MEKLLKPIFAFIIITTIVLGTKAFAADIQGPYDTDLVKYTVTVQGGKKVTLSIGREVRYSCWKAFHYTKFENGNKIVVMREALMHPMVVCDFPHPILEGTLIELPVAEYTKFYTVFLPENVDISTEDNLPLF